MKDEAVEKDVEESDVDIVNANVHSLPLLDDNVYDDDE